MKSSSITGVFASLLIVFYVSIIMYVFFGVAHIETLENFVAAIIFEIIGFILLAFFVLTNIFGRGIKVGYFASLIGITIFYTIILDVINLVFVRTISNSFFVLINLIVLFVYCLISVPIFIMGRK